MILMIKAIDARLINTIVYRNVTWNDIICQKESG